MKYYWGLLILLIGFAGHSQQTIQSIDLDIKKASQLRESFSFLHQVSSDQKYLLALAEENRVNFYVFDSTWQSTKRFSEKREWVADQGFYEDYNRFLPKVNIFFSKEFESFGTISAGPEQMINAFIRNHNIYFQKIDFSTGKSRNLTFWKSGNKERVLHRFTAFNRFFWITYDKKKEDLIRLYSFNGDEKIEEKDISINHLVQTGFSHPSGPWILESSFIDSGKQFDLLKASSRIKFYAQNSSLFIVSDRIPGSTVITDLKLNTFESTTYNIEHTPAGNDKTSISNQNSFLNNNYLFQVNTCNGVFTFSVTHLSEKQRVSHSFDKKGEIDFKNSAVMQYGVSFFGPDEKEITKTAQFIKRVDGTGLSVTAEINDHAIEVTLGSSQLVQGGGGSVFIPGGSFSVPGGQVISTPGNWISSGFYESSTKTIFFRTLLDKNNLQHLAGELSPEDRLKKIDGFYDKKNGGALDYILVDKKIITGYYDKESKKFILVHF